ncbi:MAG: MYG1 family protein [Alphaproteobacteria bacterium]|nr:MYG1 family protein [Alphaproteobacteria bacterium]
MKKIFKKNVIERMSAYSNSELTVAVHNGVFHADDVYSIALLEVLAKVCNFTLKVIRTRDEQVIANADMRVDVGMKYSEETLDFDHHQNDTNLIQEGGIKHAAFGLLCQWCLTEEFLKIFKPKYILGLEHQDNSGKTHEKYASIGHFIHAFLPSYEEEVSFDEMFNEALAVASTILERCISTTLGLIKSEKDVEKAISEVLADGKVIVMKKRIIIQQFLHPDWKFVISPDPTGGWGFLGMNGQLLNPEFRGLTPETLAQKGYRGTFTHKAGFTGILESKEEAIKLCLTSL